MVSRFNNDQLVCGMMVEEPENPPENSGGDSSSRSAVSGDAKMASTPSSSRRSRRAIQKRVVSVPIKDVEGLRMKSDHMSAPPSDSWAWRKYGQKPIKGSPYPRGYYRCSSSKGCPARKQVERSKLDPSMLVVTYSCEHNHPWLASRNNILHNKHHTTTSSAAPASTTTTITTTNATASASEEEEEEEEKEERKPVNLSNQSYQEPIPDQKFTSPGDGVAPIHGGEIGWLGDFESTTCITLESPILTEDKITADDEMALVFTIQEEDESLFADLGELPECSTVFRREMAQIEAEQRPPSLATTT